MKFATLALPLTVLLAACGPLIEGAQFRPAAETTRAEDVLVFTTRIPACAYEEVGIVSGQATDRWDSLQGVIDGMRRRAALMGGHALIQLAPAAPVHGSKTTSSTAPLFVSTVVRFTEACSDRE